MKAVNGPQAGSNLSDSERSEDKTDEEDSDDSGIAFPLYFFSFSLFVLLL